MAPISTLHTLGRLCVEPLAIGGLLTGRLLAQRGAAPLTAAYLSTSSTGGWRFGFSSSSAASRAAAADEQKAAGEQQQAAAEGAAGEQQHEQQHEQQQQAEAAAGLTPEELGQALQEAKEALEAERKRSEDMKDKLLRTLADMENLRERTARTAAEAKQYAVQGLVKNLLDVADNLERAAASVPAEHVGDSSEIDRDRALGLLRSLRDGVLMTDTVLMKVLAKEGVTRYDPLGDAFDPNLHNALFEVPDATRDAGTVAVVVKRGYMLNDRVVRAAEVGVTRAVDES
ncbi:hypothetical protein ABPG75_009714 [Micractinium tetrahymenae]